MRHNLGIQRPGSQMHGSTRMRAKGGLFGDQEHREIIPVVEAVRTSGLDVSDPRPPDTVFVRALKGEWDIVVTMYHEQGRISMKLLAFVSGEIVSIGLPIVRTSVDQGTAFDIARTGRAGEESMLATIETAVQLVQPQRANRNAG